MKSIISLAILFAFVYNAQALKTYLQVTVKYEGFGTLSGEIKGLMIAKRAQLTVLFTENLETLNYIFDLPSHNRAIDLTWNTEFSTPLEIKPLIVSWPSSGKGLVRRVFVSDKKQVENDETATFIQA